MMLVMEEQNMVSVLDFKKNPNNEEVKVKGEEEKKRGIKIVNMYL